MSDEDLIGALKRVESDLGFRAWVRHWLWAIVAVLVVVVIAVALSVMAAAQNRRTIHRIDAVVQHQCERDNDQRRAEVKLWTDLIAANPIPDLPPDATPEQVADHDARVAQVEAFVESLNRNFALEDCS